MYRQFFESLLLSFPLDNGLVARKNRTSAFWRRRLLCAEDCDNGSVMSNMCFKVRSVEFMMKSNECDVVRRCVCVTTIFPRHRSCGRPQRWASGRQWSLWLADNEFQNPPRTGHNHAGTSGEQLERDDVHRKKESGMPFPSVTRSDRPVSPVGIDTPSTTQEAVLTFRREWPRRISWTTLESLSCYRER